RFAIGAKLTGAPFASIGGGAAGLVSAGGRDTACGSLGTAVAPAGIGSALPLPVVPPDPLDPPPHAPRVPSRAMGSATDRFILSCRPSSLFRARRSACANRTGSARGGALRRPLGSPSFFLRAARGDRSFGARAGGSIRRDSSRGRGRRRAE